MVESPEETLTTTVPFVYYRVDVITPVVHCSLGSCQRSILGAGLLVVISSACQLHVGHVYVNCLCKQWWAYLCLDFLPCLLQIIAVHA